MFDHHHNKYLIRATSTPWRLTYLTHSILASTPESSRSQGDQAWLTLMSGSSWIILTILPAVDQSKLTHKYKLLIIVLHRQLEETLTYVSLQST